MLTLIVLFLSTIFLSIFVNRMLSDNFIRAKKSYEDLKNRHNSLLQENSGLAKSNDDLKSSLEEAIAIYDITKEICKYLDEDKVSGSFKDQISKYIKVEECKFLKKDEDLLAYSNYILTPLTIDTKPVGYLAVNGIARGQEGKFNILAQQFVSGIKRAILYRRVQELAITDSLTGALSRRYWLERFEQEIERSRKFKYAFSFLMLDIDYFKRFNDQYGHLVGDAILKEVSRRIKENIRQIDLICRYGGEEFSVILLETDKAGARFAAERIRQAVEENYIRVYDEEKLMITISIGISVFPEDAISQEALIEKADEALYRAKQTGRNRVCVYGIK